MTWTHSVSVPWRGYRIPNKEQIAHRNKLLLFPSPDGAIEFQICERCNAKGWAGYVSVPWRGYRIPNRANPATSDTPLLFPSPDGAIEFQIVVNYKKYKSIYEFPSPDGAIEFQIFCHNNHYLFLSLFPSPDGAIEFQIERWKRGRKLCGRVSVPWRGYRIPNNNISQLLCDLYQGFRPLTGL